ncbi:MAG: TolC family protein [Treponema sp.]|jgi:outer membrane protein TolC|nr:TolC family protein [Treponema sp.]
MGRVSVLELCFLIFVSPGLFPQEVPVMLTLDRAVERAVGQSLTLQKSAIDSASAAFAATHLWSELFPDISADAGVSYGSNLFSGEGFRLEESGLGYSLSLGVTLSLNAGLPASMKLIKLAYQTQLLTYETSRRQLEIQVAKTFYGLIAEKANLSLLEELRTLAEKQVEKNRIAFANGLIGELTLLQSQLSAETAKLTLNKARTSYATQLGEFLELLGYTQDTEAVLEGAIEIVQIDADPELLIKEHLVKRPDILSQRQTIEHLEYVQKQTALTARAPSLTLSAQWQGDSGNGGIPSGFTDTLTGRLKLSIPINPWIPGTGKSQSINTARMNVDKARLDLKNTETGAMNEIRSLAANLRDSWSNIEISRLRVTIAERTYQLTEQGFQSGTVEFLTLEDTRNKMAEARQQLLSDELNYKTMMLDLAAALNVDWNDVAGSIP